MEYGPIHLVVVGFEDNTRFQGEIMRELDAVRSRGVIRLIDALFVAKDEDGEIFALEESDVSREDAAGIGSTLRALLGMQDVGAGNGSAADALIAGGIGLTVDEVRSAGQALEPGTSALYLLFEHTWAAGLKEAIRNAGGFPLVQGILTPEAVLMVGAELDAVLEAEATIELAEAVKGAAILDALATMAEAEAVADDAVREAEEIVAAADAIRSAAAAEAVRALIVAGMIEEAAAAEAADVLVAAGLIEAAALEAAAEAAEAAAAEVATMSEATNAQSAG